MDELSESIARYATLRYQRQISKTLPTNNGSELLAVCFVKRVLVTMVSHDLNSEIPVHIQLVNHVGLLSSKLGKFKLSNINIEADPKTVKLNGHWTDLGIFLESGIITAEGKKYVSKGELPVEITKGFASKSNKYSFRLGSEEEAITAGLTQISAKKAKKKTKSRTSSHSSSKKISAGLAKAVGPTIPVSKATHKQVSDTTKRVNKQSERQELLSAQLQMEKSRREALESRLNELERQAVFSKSSANNTSLTSDRDSDIESVHSRKSHHSKNSQTRLRGDSARSKRSSKSKGKKSRDRNRMPSNKMSSTRSPSRKL